MNNQFLRDLTYCVRSLLRNRTFTVIGILALSLGIGANTAIFSVVNAVVIRPLPYPEPESLVWVFERPPSGGHNGISALNFLDWTAQATSFSAMAASTGGNLVLTDSGDAERLAAGRVSAGFFDVMGVKPALGRAFLPEDDRPGAPPVVILSHGTWERHYGGDPALIGGTIPAGEQKYTVVGVMPRSFQFFQPFDVLVPLALDPAPQRSAITTI